MDIQKSLDPLLRIMMLIETLAPSHYHQLEDALSSQY